jgi:ubiquinone/menaquinone biosynthesis C-methylase UbiE
MTGKFLGRGEHLEPPPWLYARLAQGPLMRVIYRFFVGDLVAALPLNTRLLDVGTGPGYLPEYLAPVRPDLEIWGVDCSYDMIRRAQPRPVRWVVADACSLPFAEAVFDQVIATFTFHIWPCPVSGINELQRLLKPGGRAWIYELRREATVLDLKAFAGKVKLPFPLVYLGFRIISRHHAVPAPEFAQILKQAAVPRGSLQPLHHIFWRAELEGL